MINGTSSSKDFRDTYHKHGRADWDVLRKTHDLTNTINFGEQNLENLLETLIVIEVVYSGETLCIELFGISAQETEACCPKVSRCLENIIFVRDHDKVFECVKIAFEFGIDVMDELAQCNHSIRVIIGQRDFGWRGTGSKPVCHGS